MARPPMPSDKVQPMEPDRATSPAEASSSWQLVGRIVLGMAVVGFGIWILFDFLPALAWAAVLAIALWPLYRRLWLVLPPHGASILAPLLMTVAVGIIVIAPLVLLGIALARESHVVFGLVSEARHHGIPVPYWIGELPLIGPVLAEWWRDNLSDPAIAEELIGRVNVHTLTQSAREYGGEVVHRLALLLFTLLTLFFLFRDGGRLTEDLRDLSDRMIGLRGE